MCMKKLLRPGTYSPGLERIVPGDHMGSVSYNAYFSVILENLVTHGALGRVFRKASTAGNNYPY